MSSARFFVSDKFIDTQHATVTIADHQMVFQISHVLRLKKGDPFTVLDGKGRLYHCLLTKLESCLVESKIIGCERMDGNPAVNVTIALPLLKGERFDWAIQKLTELGVAAVIPVICSRCVVKAKSPDKLVRWQTIMREASEQCERSTIPQIVSPVSFVNLMAGHSIEKIPANGLKFLCLERRTTPSLYDSVRSLKAQLSQTKNICLFIGPEGGFTKTEIELAISYSCQLVSLGSRILRSETAALYALSQVIAFADNELREI